ARQPASRAAPGASIAAADGWTADAEQTSSSPPKSVAADQAMAPDRAGLPLMRRRSTAPQTTADETTAPPTPLVASRWFARSAARPAFKAPPGATTGAASGSIADAVQTSVLAAASNPPVPRILRVSDAA